MVRYALLAAEGPHDQAAVGKMLELVGLQRFQGKTRKLDPFWQKFVPTYPGATLYTRLDMPSIYYSAELSVAVYHGGGSNLTTNLTATLTNHPPYRQDIVAFGLVADADTRTPNAVARRFTADFRRFFPTLPEEPGQVSPGPPRTGIYILPDNRNQGTLDTILVRCADIVYPHLKEGAATYLDQIDSEHKRHWKSFDEHKALVATITSVLKPGATNTASIAQNDWISTQSLTGIAEVAAFQRFLQDLLGLSL